LTLHLLTNADAAIAVDALRHIYADVRVSLIQKADISCAQAFTFELVASKIAMKLLVREATHRVGRVLPCQQLEEGSPELLKLICMGLDDHPVG
jgi:hypothetical protein